MIAPDLGLHIVVNAGLDLPNGNTAAEVTTYTFTPTKKGTFRWFCAVPCDAWAMEAGPAGPGRVLGYNLISALSMFRSDPGDGTVLTVRIPFSGALLNGRAPVRGVPPRPCDPGGRPAIQSRRRRSRDADAGQRSRDLWPRI